MKIQFLASVLAALVVLTDGCISLTPDFRDTVASAKASVSPSVVYIRVIYNDTQGGKDRKGQSSGSGVVISADGDALDVEDSFGLSEEERRRLWIIDCITRTMEPTASDSERVKYVASPVDLTGMGIRFIVLFGLVMAVFALLNVLVYYHLALDRRGFIGLLVAGAAAEVAGILLFHETLPQVLLVMLVVGAALLVLNLAVAILERPEPPGG